MKRTILTLLLVSTAAAAARDATRYPRDTAAHSTEHLGGFRGRYQEFIVLNTQVRVDPTYTDGQKGLLRDAMEHVMARMLRPEIIDCAYRASTKDMPKSRLAFETDVATALSPFRIGEAIVPAFVFIARFWNDPKAVGIGYLSLFYDTSLALPELGIRSHLHIALNSDFLGYDSRYVFAKDTEYWAGVIAHEFLHNLGYDHPTGYKGSFIEEYGNCVATNGVRGETPRDAIPDRTVRKGQ